MGFMRYFNILGNRFCGAARRVELSAPLPFGFVYGAGY
jgi:hypothetical protein